MNEQDTLTQEEFERLLSWLDADREPAGIKYETIRRGLIEVFRCRGCLESEDLADRTINRVARKVKEIDNSYAGDPSRYFFGVAKNLLKEYQRPRTRVVLPNPSPASDDGLERSHECLDRCLSQFSSENRELILLYYSKDKQPGRDSRKELAKRWNLTSGALRVRMHRIRADLEECVRGCVNE